MTPLLVLVTVILLFTIGYILRRTVGAHRKVLAPSVRELSFNDFRLPQGIFYAPHHTWVSIRPQGQVRIGIDDFILKLIGSVQSIEVPPIGDETTRGKPLTTLGVGTESLQLTAPLSGKIVALNEDILQDPSMAFNGPLVGKWIVELEPSHLSEEVSGLTVAEKASDWFKAEIERCKVFLGIQASRPALAGATLPDGGAQVVGVLRLLDADGIAQFKQEFLST